MYACKGEEAIDCQKCETIQWLERSKVESFLLREQVV